MTVIKSGKALESLEDLIFRYPVKLAKTSINPGSERYVHFSRPPGQSFITLRNESPPYGSEDYNLLLTVTAHESGTIYRRIDEFSRSTGISLESVNSQDLLEEAKRLKIFFRMYKNKPEEAIKYLTTSR